MAAKSPQTKKSTTDEQRSRLESLGVLSSCIVHDLNNILTGILGHVSFLRLSACGAQDSVSAIEEGTKRAAALVQKMLSYARGGDWELRPVNLSRLVRDNLALLRGTFVKDVELSTRGLEKDQYVLGDEAQLSQLILNLATNARDSVGKKGQVTVELTVREMEDGEYCAEMGISPGRYALLAVKDNGIGIPEELREKIFEPFFTTKPGSGTGLGLAMVQAIVKSHRGNLALHSAKGKGTCFEILIPEQLVAVENNLKAESSNTSGETRANGREVAMPNGSERILLVDDEEAVRTIVQRSLEHLGYQVVAASGGEEALKCYQREANFSLVIVDMIMPNMAGDELMAKLQDLDRNVPILIATGYASDQRTKAMINQGALGMIRKPFAVEELAVEVRRCLQLREARNPSYQSI